MTNENTGAASGGALPDRIDPGSDEAVAAWARKLDSTEMQIRDAIGRVGDLATDVEMDLKGTRATTNIDRVDETGTATPDGARPA